MTASSMTAGPLAGMRVIEFVGVGPGPLCGMLLADLGAQVLRVDRTEPSGRSQFQPPSGCRSPTRRATSAATSTPKYAPSATVRPLMHSSVSPDQYG